ADDHALGGHRAGHLALLPDNHLAPADVTLDFSINLERSLADDLEPLADDLEVVADHRFGCHIGRGWAALRLRLRGVQIGSNIVLDRLKLLRLGGGITREHCRPRWSCLALARMPAPPRGGIVSGRGT